MKYEQARAPPWDAGGNRVSAFRRSGVQLLVWFTPAKTIGLNCKKKQPHPSRRQLLAFCAPMDDRRRRSSPPLGLGFFRTSWSSDFPQSISSLRCTPTPQRQLLAFLRSRFFLEKYERSPDVLPFHLSLSSPLRFALPHPPLSPQVRTTEKRQPPSVFLHHRPHRQV